MATSHPVLQEQSGPSESLLPLFSELSAQQWCQVQACLCSPVFWMEVTSPASLQVVRWPRPAFFIPVLPASDPILSATEPTGGHPEPSGPQSYAAGRVEENDPLPNSCSRSPILSRSPGWAHSITMLYMNIAFPGVHLAERVRERQSQQGMFPWRTRTNTEPG